MLYFILGRTLTLSQEVWRRNLMRSHVQEPTLGARYLSWHSRSEKPIIFCVISKPLLPSNHGNGWVPGVARKTWWCCLLLLSFLEGISLFVCKRDVHMVEENQMSIQTIVSYNHAICSNSDT